MFIAYCATSIRRRSRRGQTLVESILMMPLFLLLVFFLLQIGHLGIAIAIVHYSASSAAKQAVEQNSDANLQQRVQGLFSAGLKNGTASATYDSQDPVTRTIIVTACGELLAYPFVGPFLSKALSSQANGSGCAPEGKAMGPVILKGPPFVFIIQGEARARMNYNPKRP